MNKYNIKSSLKSRMREGYLKDSRLEVPGKTMQTDRKKLKKESYIYHGAFVEQPFVNNVNINNLAGLNTSKMTKTHA
jgi:molybdopterin converting factor small subunit